MIELTTEEARVICDLINQLSGGNAEYCFAWDGTDSWDDVNCSAVAKVFLAVGRDIPKEMVK